MTLASNGDVRTYYLDAESCVPIKYEVKRTVRGAERWFEAELGDYKEVQGVLFPFSMRDRREGKLECRQAAVRVGSYHGEPAARRSTGSGSPRRERRSCRPTPRRQNGTAGRVRRRFPRPRASVALMRLATMSATVDSETISGLGARNIGSAAMSGRVDVDRGGARGRIVSPCTSAPRAAVCGSR